MTTHPNFDIDYAEGRQAELWAENLRASLADGRVQVKLDRRFIDTGNIYVERTCRYPSGRRASGVDEPDAAPLWVYQLRDTGVAVVFDVDTLRRVVGDRRMAWPGRTYNDAAYDTTGSVVRLRSVFQPGALR